MIYSLYKYKIYNKRKQPKGGFIPLCRKFKMLSGKKLENEISFNPLILRLLIFTYREKVRKHYVQSIFTNNISI